MELQDLAPSDARTPQPPSPREGDRRKAVVGAPCRRLGSHPASFGLISRRICLCLFPPLRPRLYGLSSLKVCFGRDCRAHLSVRRRNGCWVGVFCLGITALGGKGSALVHESRKVLRTWRSQCRSLLREAKVVRTRRRQNPKSHLHEDSESITFLSS